MAIFRELANRSIRPGWTVVATVGSYYCLHACMRILYSRSMLQYRTVRYLFGVDIHKNKYGNLLQSYSNNQLHSGSTVQYCQ